MSREPHDAGRLHQGVVRPLFYPANSDDDEHERTNILYPLTSDEEDFVNRLDEAFRSDVPMSDSDVPPTDASNMAAGVGPNDPGEFNAAIQLIVGENGTSGPETSRVARRLATEGWDLHEPVHSSATFLDEEPTLNWRADYPGLRHSRDGPTTEVLKIAESPLDLFFFFMPKDAWRSIAAATNQYRDVNRPSEGEERAPKRTRRESMVMSSNIDPIRPHELCVFVGLLIASTIHPSMEGISSHWCTDDNGALPAGKFERFMSEARFTTISSNLYFNSNDADQHQARPDSLWKLRPVIDVLQHTFRQGHDLPDIMSYDHECLPSRPGYGKDHDDNCAPVLHHSRFGLLCSAQDGYCVGFEVYLGVRRAKGWRMRQCTGLIRLVTQVFGNQREANAYRLIAIAAPPQGRALALLQLYSMGFYTISKTRTGNTAYPSVLPTELKCRPGSFQVCSATAFPRMKALVWKAHDLDSHHFIGVGGSVAPAAMNVFAYNGSKPTVVQCPRVIKVHAKYSQAAHQHFVLQRLSLQRSIRFTKYYRTLFLGLLDMALVNAYLVYREHWRRKAAYTTDPTYIGFLKSLQLALCQITERQIM